MVKKKLTPMMEQYYEIKSEYPDCILFFRLGDFYEMFEEDAKLGSEILDITLTSRAKGENAIPMAGVPYHSAENYIAKLCSKGHKVAICEQTSDPDGTGIVSRAVKRVVTPGTNLTELKTNQKENLFVASLAGSPKQGFALALADVSTGEILVSQAQNLEEIESFLNTYNVKELIAPEKLSQDPAYYHLISSSFATSKNPAQLLLNHFALTTLSPLGIDQNPLYLEATALLLEYLESVMKTDISHLNNVKLLADSDKFSLDQATIYNLEIFYTIRDFSRENTLLSVIDKTQTSGGGRLLKQWIMRPLKSLEKLRKRQSFVTKYLNSADLDNIRSNLGQTYDLERLLSRLSMGYANPRDLIQVKDTLKLSPVISQLADYELPTLSEIYDLINRAIVAEPPLSTRDAGIFQDGYNLEADEYRTLLREGKSFIAKHQADLIAQTGIQKLKVGFNKVFGYYIEVSKGKSNLVPESFIRKQTLVNSERYITPELKEYEEKVLKAEDLLKDLEEKLFHDLVSQILARKEELRSLASKLAFLDLVSSFASLAKTKNYCLPDLNETQNLNIINARHPVLEHLLPSGTYIPNDIIFDNNTNLKLITGPNMGGKSTYLRQTALIVLLAQIGSYVPADSAQIGLVDQIYSRVGASDNLSKGLSIFMGEMEETSYILRHATLKSLLILDEIGRGTSTYDGVSIAWSVLEYIHNNLQARTLFATHYHELIGVVDDLEKAKNYSVAVQEDAQGKAVFLHQIQEGAVSKSYGVHVASKAGLPVEVVARAEQLLRELEITDVSLLENQTKSPTQLSETNDSQPSLFSVQQEDPKAKLLKESLQKLELNSLTPVQALVELEKLKNLLDS
jgi:DNA mismatch repair protein MutS